MTRKLLLRSQSRNDFIVALANSVLIPHASPGGNAELTARQAINRGQSLFTIKDPENDALIQLGAHPYKIETMQ